MRSIRPVERPPRSRRTTVLRALLLTTIPGAGVRLVDVVILPIGMMIAMVICLPILTATILAGAAIGLALQQAGAPATVTGWPGLIGFVCGLALGFVVLLRIYRRFPARIRSWVTPEDNDQPVGAVALPFASDRAADDATFHERVAAADSTLGVDEVDAVDDRGVPR